jgi:antirestriction protein ArdC
VVRPRLYRQANVFGGESEQAHGFKSYTVINYEEVNRVDHEHPDLFGISSPPPSGSNGEAEQVVAASLADIRYEGNRALCDWSLDRIYMPPRWSFKATTQASASENFYATLLHELIHWTKQPHRCDRKPLFDDSEQSYAFEELVAELGAAVLNTRFHKLPAPRPDHAAYLDSWLRVLEHDFRYFYRAMRLAQDAGDWLCRRAGLDDHVSLPDAESSPDADNEAATQKPQH